MSECESKGKLGERTGDDDGAEDARVDGCGTEDEQLRREVAERNEVGDERHVVASATREEEHGAEARRTHILLLMLYAA